MDSVNKKEVKVGAVKAKWRQLSDDYPNFNVLASTFVIFFVLVVILSFASSSFMTARNITNILNQSAVYIVMGVGMTLVLTTGGIDISVGAIVGLTTSVVGLAVIGSGYPWWIGVIIALVVGGLCGAFNGLLVVKFKVPSIIVTLGSMTALRGLAYALLEGRIFYGYSDSFLWIGRGRVLGIPVPVWIALITVIIGQYFLTKTKTGRHITALGSSEDAARLAGIPVDKIRMLVFVIMGVLAGVATLILTARLGSSEATAGTGMEIHTISSVVVGGTALAGGKGLMLGTLMGALILAVLENGLLLAGVSFFWQRVMLGLIFIMVVAFRSFQSKETSAS